MKREPYAYTVSKRIKIRLATQNYDKQARKK